MSNTYAKVARHPLRFFAIAAIALVTLLLVTRAGASPSDTTFELDGNTHANDFTPSAHDWSQVFANSGTGADKALFIPDVFPNAPDQANASDDDQPATGATKDPNDMDQWNCKAAGLAPPKNDIADAFVASYTVAFPTDAAHPQHQIIYFGMDRVNSDNGTADVGFWFTKTGHDCDPSGGTATWTGGKHVLGDTLVVSEFTGGGRVSTVKVFVWCSNPAGTPDLKCGSSTSTVVPAATKGDGPLQLVFTGADCLDDAGAEIKDPAHALACATVNRTINTDGPEWPYDGAGTPSNTYERGALFEGGIDATGLNLDLVCLGTFVADTRSAASTTAQLHDFTIGQVEACTATVATTSSLTGTVLAGLAVSDTATVTQTPASAPTPTGTVKFFLCQPSEVTAGGCVTGGTQIGTPLVGETLNASGVAVSESTSNTTAIGKYCWRAEYSGDSRFDPASHTNALTAAAGGVTPECFITFNPSTLVSFSDRIVNLPSDATGSVTYGVFTDSGCTTPVTTGTPSNGNITPNPATVTGGIVPPSLSYEPVAAGGTFWIKATFTGTLVYAGVNFTSCIEKVAVDNDTTN